MTEKKKKNKPKGKLGTRWDLVKICVEPEDQYEAYANSVGW